MPTSREEELKDIIDELEEGYVCLKYSHQLEIKELIAEFLSDIPKLSRTELIKKYYKMLV